MENINFIADEEKCIHCGLCKKDCIADVIEYNENGIPEAKYAHRCIECGHCMAICPVGAIEISGKIPSNAENVYSQNPDMILNLIKSRRSCRQYKNENLDAETMNKLKNMLKYVPTGCNFHGLEFSITEDKEVTEEIRNYVNEKLKKILTSAPANALTEKFGKYKDIILSGEDIIFRNAPHIITVSNSVKAPCTREDGIIALSYFELYANSLGVGTCWCGFGEAILKAFPELCGYLKIKPGYQPVYVMLFGPKSVDYSRTIQPEDVVINTIPKGKIENLSAFDKIKRCFWNFVR